MKSVPIPRRNLSTEILSVHIPNLISPIDVLDRKLYFVSRLILKYSVAGYVKVLRK
jgi:hypothetical protein